MHNPKAIHTKSKPTLPRTTCSALVTRYPTGCFGINYQGSMFYWWGFKEAEAHAELKRLRIPAKRVKWEERYYDKRYDFNDPRSYKTRKFVPQAQSSSTPNQSHEIMSQNQMQSKPEDVEEPREKELDDDEEIPTPPMEDRWDYDHGPDHVREVLES
jgi:hypothetical protein